jgi:hypothetical protein
MPEPVVCIDRCDGRQGLTQRGIERFTGPRLRGAQAGCDLRPARLNRRQIRRGGGPIPEADAPPRQPVLDADGLVRSQVVPHDEVTGGQRGPKPMLHVGVPHVGSRGALHRQHGVEALLPQRGQPRHMLPVGLGHAPDDPLPLRGAAIQAGPGQIHPRCIDALQALRRERLDDLPVVGPRLLDSRRVPRRGVERLLWRGSPSRVRRRDLVDTRTQRPRRCPSRSHSSANVASVCSWRPWPTTASAA